jgi:toxin-antitoxin system PIN domain toxin
MKYLLDVNTLIAAIWTDHANHAVAENWIKGKELATCPLSELGFLRISTNPKALGATMPDARKLLDNFSSEHDVEFVPADLPALKSSSRNSDEVTDRYLAELAASKAMKLATLDKGMVHAAAEIIG